MLVWQCSIIRKTEYPDCIEYRVVLPAKAWEYVFTDAGLRVCVCVCLSETTITKKIVDGFRDLYQILWEGS